MVAGLPFTSTPVTEPVPVHDETTLMYGRVASDCDSPVRSR
jgi:hypothetical protein